MSDNENKNESKIAVATYNMSFMSALGYPEDNKMRHGSSEGAFLAQNKTDDQRLYWKNALDLLINFIQKNHDDGITCVIGLQEIIGPNGSTNRVMYEDTKGTNIGSDEITVKLDKFNNDNGTKYIQVVDEVLVMFGAFKSDIGLSIIYDTNRFGNEKIHNIYDARLNKTDSDLTEKNNEKKDGEQYYLQDGRPLLIVVTAKNCVFITAHGAQDGKLFPKYKKPDQTIQQLTEIAKEDFITFNTNTKNHQTYIQDRVSDYLTKKNIIPNELFLMADLNDRFDVIKDFTFTINNEDFNIKYTGQAPNSCCNNWDASCRDGRYIPLDDNGNGYCIQPDTLPSGSVRNGDNIVSIDNKIKISETEFRNFKIGITEGEKENYRYKCDKVFGINPQTEIEIFDNTTSDEVSNKSDHQMVHALFTTDNCYDDDGDKKCGDVKSLIDNFGGKPVGVNDTKNDDTNDGMLGGNKRKLKRSVTKKYKKCCKPKTKKRTIKNNKPGRRKTIRRTTRKRSN